MDVLLSLRLDRSTARALETAAASSNLPKTALARHLIVQGLAGMSPRDASSGLMEFAGSVDGPGIGASNASVRRKLKSTRVR